MSTMNLAIGINNFDKFGLLKQKFTEQYIADATKGLDPEFLSYPRGYSFREPGVFRTFADGLCGAARVAAKTVCSFAIGAVVTGFATPQIAELLFLPSPAPWTTLILSGVGGLVGAATGYEAAKSEEKSRRIRKRQKAINKDVIRAWTSYFNTRKSDADLLKARMDLFDVCQAGRIEQGKRQFGKLAASVQSKNL